MVQEAQNVHSWLFNSRKISVPDDWLEACIEWIHAESEGSLLSSNDVCNAVFEQWLVADLSEIGASCLPTDVVSQPKYTLTGCYGLQMNSIVDVSRPLYGQLQNLTGSDNSNVHVSATQSTQANKSQQTASRMLMLQLTDGAVQVRAMEYRPIPALNAGLTSGTKILVHGTVLCRRGVLMLTADNVTIYGGEVDSLLEVSQQQLISSKLAGNVELIESRPELPRQTYQHQTKTNTNRNNISGTSLDHCNALPITRHSASSVSTHYSRTSSTNLLSNDMFMDDGDDDIFLRDALNTERSMSLSSVSNDISSSRQQSLTNRLSSKQRQDVDTARSSKSLSTVTTDARSSFPAPPRTYAGSLPSFSSISSAPAPCVAGRAGNSDASVKKMKVEVDLMEEDNDFENDFDTETMLIMTTDTTEQQNSTCRNSFGGSIDNSISSSIDNSRQTQASVRRNVASSIDSSLMSSSRVCQAVEVRARQTTSSRVTTSDSGIITSANITGSRQSAVCDKQLFTNRSMMDVKDYMADRNMKEVKHGGVASNNSLADNVDICSDSVAMTTASTSSVPTTPPFTYLSIIMKLLSTDVKDSVYSVKAYIATLLGRLEANEGNYWSLLVKINDGTAALDVVICDQLLTEMIGFSAAQSLVIKQDRTDRRRRQLLSEGVRRCQEILTNLSAIIELKFSYRSRPVMLRYRPVTADDVKSLRQRALL